MTHKEIAERLRTKVTDHYDAVRLADELDPPRPEPGTVVWFRGVFFGASKTWQLGESEREGVYPFASESCFSWKDIEWKPARIAGPMQEIVDIPPARMWSPDVAYMDILLSPLDADFYPFGATTVRHITRAEAEAMEVEYGE